MKKLLLIDTFNFLHRAFHALPGSFRDSNGEPTNAVYGVTSMLINIFDSIKPDYAVAALDGEKPTFRVGDFTGYKAHRAEIDPNLVSQIPKVFEVLDAFGVKKIVVEGYEADDVIGTLAKKFASKTCSVIIASNDRDLWQLINEHVTVMVPTTAGTAEWIGEQEVVSRLGIAPGQVVDYKALKGDASDNIPGVHGIGDKTARELVQAYGSVEEIYKNIAGIVSASVREKLANNAEEAVMSKHLATIITNAPFGVSLDECAYRAFNKAAVVEVLKRYNFKSLIRRLGFEVDEKKAPSAVSADQPPLF
ncbi:MAG: hypothetical protein UX73_C0015G0012 [candidate division WWE3 bacterium GW2011_GWC1_47_10]|uniref:5'-3' exonuclease domain-containing protein n=1 Tax=candidate division WWE3 bacterium GW2011_GWC1_47_10 TaxID=1619122 RepID=A0A0G1R0V4_UNCKA|nr:MAG: hypothetical protein UX73_C0015G0012 [candidate division WWE3 bacterium GW2011_GWC1_47_10]